MDENAGDMADDARPKNGYWVIRHWRDSPDLSLHGSFTAPELRWLAGKLDEHNAARPLIS